MVFLLAVCAFQDFRHWKRLIILITAFTLGHSITLILAAFKVISFPVEIVEFLIPVTIFITALSGFTNQSKSSNSKAVYFLILFFGLIHGIGFSNYLLMLLGNESSVLWPLFAFNVGIELGQIFIILIILIVKTILEFIPFLDRQKFRYWLSGIAAGISLILMIDTKFW